MRHLDVTRRFRRRTEPDEKPLGEGGDLLHEWAFAAMSWREQHGLEGGEKNADSEVVEESLAATGAVVMGRRMFSGGEGPWEDDPRADGWWGEDPPFHVPVFVLTHHARATKTMQGGTSFTFVTDGIEAALEAGPGRSGRAGRPAGRRRPRRPAVPEGRIAGRATDSRRARASGRGDVPLRPARNRAARTRSDEGDRVSVRHPPALQGRDTYAVDQLGCSTIRM